MDNQQERSRLELAWLGGIIDGEGSLTLRKHRKRKENYIIKPVIVINNTNKIIIDNIIRIYKKNDIAHWTTLVEYNNKKWKNYWSISIEGLRRIDRAIKILGPWLVGKKRHAEILKKFCTSRLNKLGKHVRYSEKELKLVEEIKSLNK